MREMGVNQNFQPPPKNGVVWPNYSPCRKFEIRPPPPPCTALKWSTIHCFFMKPFCSLGTINSMRSSRHIFKTLVSHFILQFSRVMRRTQSEAGMPASLGMQP